MRYLITAAIVAMLIGLTGCSDEKSSNPAGPGTQNTPAIPQINFKGPNTNSQDPNALIAKSNAASMNIVITQSTIFAAIPAQQNGNTYTWSITIQGVTYTLTAVKQNDGSYIWTVVLNGTDGSDTFNNFKACEGTSSADGKSGTWTTYDYGVVEKAAEFIYSTNANNVITGTTYLYENDGTLMSKTIIVNNPDGSGSLELYNDGVHMNYKSVWIANGSGTWYTYDSSGVQIETGTWT